MKYISFKKYSLLSKILNGFRGNYILKGFSCDWFQYLYYYLRGFPYLRSFFFFGFKKAPTPLCLIRDKTKGQSSKNATLMARLVHVFKN